MKTNRLLTILLILTLALSVTLLVGCGCEHANTEWQWDANSHKQVCTDCNKVLGTANSHDWSGVSCSVCQMGAEYAQGLEYELSSNGAYYTVTGKGTFTGEILLWRTCKTHCSQCILAKPNNYTNHLAKHN